MVENGHDPDNVNQMSVVWAGAERKPSANAVLANIDNQWVVLSYGEVKGGKVEQIPFGSGLNYAGEVGDDGLLKNFTWYVTGKDGKQVVLWQTNGSGEMEARDPNGGYVPMGYAIKLTPEGRQLAQVAVFDGFVADLMDQNRAAELYGLAFDSTTKLVTREVSGTEVVEFGIIDGRMVKVADGIANGDGGEKYIYDARAKEWQQLAGLPAEAGELAVKVDEARKVVAVDANGEVAFEYDMAAGNWVEVVREPREYVVAPNEAMKRAIENLPFPSDYPTLNYDDVNHTPVELGYLGKNHIGSEGFSAVVLGILQEDDYDANIRPEYYAIVFGMRLPNGDEVRVALTIYPNPPALMQENVDPTSWSDTPNKNLKAQNGIYNESDKEKIVMYLKNNAVGKQVFFTMGSNPSFREIMKMVEGKEANEDVACGESLQLGAVWLMDPSLP